jgi:hypothetical protein
MGITPAQHQLLLCIRGNPDQQGLTIGEGAASLILRHHRTREQFESASRQRAVDWCER